MLIGAFGNTGPCLPADLNVDEVVDTADLGIMIGAWGPCGGEAASGGGGSSVSSLLAEMGFDTIDAYIAWLDTLTEKQIIRHIIRLFDLLEGH